MMMSLSMSRLDERRLRIRGEGTQPIYEPGRQGCAFCNGTGYRGRIGVYEMMPVSKELQAVISKGATADVIEKQALKEGMLTLKMGAAQHVLNGITSISEMKKITYETGDEY